MGSAALSNATSHITVAASSCTHQEKETSATEVLQIGERERIQAAEDALARRRKVVAKLEAQANCQAQQQRAFARVSLTLCPVCTYLSLLKAALKLVSYCAATELA